MDAKKYRIGELSALSGLSVKTLRFYADGGLLAPDEVDIFTGYRYYSAAKLEECYKIVAFKELGFSLSEVKAALGEMPAAALASLLEEKGRVLAAEQRRAEARVETLRLIAAALKKESDTVFSIVKKDSGEFHAACERKLFKDRSEVLAALEGLKKALSPVRGERACLLNYNLEVNAEPFDAGICAELKPGARAPGYGVKSVSSGESLHLICRLESLAPAYSALYGYMDANGLTAENACAEIYYGDGTVELAMPVRGLPRADGAGDGIALPFEDDPEAVGKWELAAVAPHRDFYNQDCPKADGDNIFKTLYFLPGGKRYWVFGWTKGKLLLSTGDGDFTAPYVIESRGGRTVMFIEMPGGAEVYAYEKADSREYAEEALQTRDDTGLPFEPDAALPGKWVVRGFFSGPLEDFAADSPLSGFDFWQTIEVEDGGRCVITYKNGFTLSPPRAGWTKGFILDRRSALAERYAIVPGNSGGLLAVEWKSGDYTYGGKVQGCYVFGRA